MRIGVVGLGRRISGVIYGPVREMQPDIHVTGVVDPDEKGARSRLSEQDRKEAVFYRTLDEMVRRAKPDALHRDPVQPAHAVCNPGGKV